MRLGFLLLFFPPLAAHAGEWVQKYPIDAKLDGPRSAYTDFILRQIKSWTPRPVIPAAAGVTLECIETPGKPHYIGLKQTMRVDAPLASVEALVDDVNHYKDLFPGFADIHLVSADANRWLTSWEEMIPVFFIPNVKYRVWYLLDKSSPDRRVYRYQLQQSSNLKNDDGMILLARDPVSPDKTDYTEYDFYDADWGILVTFAPGRIWKDSVETIYLSDLAIKFKAEHPGWSAERAVAESRKILKANPVDAAIAQKTHILE